MEIGIIGAGNVGGLLGEIFAQNGHNIVFGVRVPRSKKMQSVVFSTNGKVRADSVQKDS